MPSQVPPARTIAIGDIHGCAHALEVLLEQIKPQRDDVIITLGDYVDRGDDSRGVLDRLIRLEDECHFVPLLGNHEVMMLAAFESAVDRNFWLRFGGQETLQSYGGRMELIPEEHLDFMRGLDLHYETATHFFLHANYAADLELDEQPDGLRFWQHISGFLPPPHQSGRIAVVGHTPQVDGEVFDAGHLICLDTYCVGTGCLTAMDVDRREYWRVDKHGQVWSK